jgi:hypothetical protein
MHRVPLIDALIRASFPDRASIRSASVMKMDTKNADLAHSGRQHVNQVEPADLQQLLDTLRVSVYKNVTFCPCVSVLTLMCDGCCNLIPPHVEYRFLQEHDGTSLTKVVGRFHVSCANQLQSPSKFDCSASSLFAKLFYSTIVNRRGFRDHGNILSAHTIISKRSSCHFDACTSKLIQDESLAVMTAPQKEDYSNLTQLKIVHLGCLEEYVAFLTHNTSSNNAPQAATAEEPVSIPESPADSDSEPAILPREPDLDLEAEHESEFEPPEPLEFTLPGHTLTRVNPNLAVVLYDTRSTTSCDQCQHPILSNYHQSNSIYYRDALKSWHQFCDPVHNFCTNLSLRKARLRMNA